MLFAAVVPAEFAAGEAAAAGAAELDVAAPGVNDFTYATSAFNCSSVTCPLKVGMIGWNPWTTCDAGLRIELRM